ncbi:vomeronasal type-1 receptor 90-like [Nycticebus coucang]|uniref:vomeronasal type-1 receptor 90-like n=1 Tax=Nycticebus coucang TaxID=9470 RepID=UPI00234C1AA8|nr:vomeronasal type-1 receptor 90-like [Nycticebus coucang]
MNINNKFSAFIAIKDVFFSEVGLGISANAILLLFHIFKFLLKHRPKSTDLTIGHLALIHIIMLLTVGFIATDLFGSQEIWDDIKCKSVIYLYRLMRGLSISTTSLLSVLQAITLSPRSSCLAKFKQKPSHNLCSFIFLWVFNMTISARYIVSTVATPNVTSDSLLFVTESCSLWPATYLIKYTFFSLLTFRDVFLIGLMALSSGYMVILLFRHKRQSQHLHSTNLSPKASPEQRATQTILLLMTFFVVIYFLDFIICFSLGILWNNDPVHLCVQMLVTNGYATISPLVLISTEQRIIKALPSMWGKDSNV